MWNSVKIALGFKRPKESPGLEDLFLDVLRKIFSYLDMADLSRLATTNKAINDILKKEETTTDKNSTYARFLSHDIIILINALTSVRIHNDAAYCLEIGQLDPSYLPDQYKLTTRLSKLLIEFQESIQANYFIAEYFSDMKTLSWLSQCTSKNILHDLSYAIKYLSQIFIVASECNSLKLLNSQKTRYYLNTLLSPKNIENFFFKNFIKIISLYQTSTEANKKQFESDISFLISQSPYGKKISSEEDFLYKLLWNIQTYPIFTEIPLLLLDMRSNPLLKKHSHNILTLIAKVQHSTHAVKLTIQEPFYYAFEIVKEKNLYHHLPSIITTYLALISELQKNKIDTYWYYYFLILLQDLALLQDKLILSADIGWLPIMLEFSFSNYIAEGIVFDKSQTSLGQIINIFLENNSLAKLPVTEISNLAENRIAGFFEHLAGQFQNADKDLIIIIPQLARMLNFLYQVGGIEKVKSYYLAMNTFNSLGLLKENNLANLDFLFDPKNPFIPNLIKIMPLKSIAPSILTDEIIKILIDLSLNYPEETIFSFFHTLAEAISKKILALPGIINLLKDNLSDNIRLETATIILKNIINFKEPGNNYSLENNSEPSLAKFSM